MVAENAKSNVSAEESAPTENPINSVEQASLQTPLSPPLSDVDSSHLKRALSDQPPDPCFAKRPRLTIPITPLVASPAPLRGILSKGPITPSEKTVRWASALIDERTFVKRPYFEVPPSVPLQPPSRVEKIHEQLHQPETPIIYYEDHEILDRPPPSWYTSFLDLFHRSPSTSLSEGTSIPAFVLLSLSPVSFRARETQFHYREQTEREAPPPRITRQPQYGSYGGIVSQRNRDVIIFDLDPSFMN